MDTPWLQNEEWASGRISSKTGGAVIAVWIMAVLANGLVWTVMALVWRDPSQSDLVKVLWLFGLLALVLLCFAVRATWGWVRYGSSTLELSSIPGVIGGTLEGVVQARMRSLPAKPVQFSLTCNRQYRVKSSRKSGEGDKTETAILWQGDTSLPVDRLTPGPDRLSLPFRVRIPHGLPGSDSSLQDEKIFWKLQVSCDVPGVDFHADFEVPVFVTAASDPAWTKEAVDAMTEEEERVHATPGSEAAELGGTHTSQPTGHGGTRYEFRLALPKKTAAALLWTGLLITGGSALLYAWLGELGPFALLPGAFGLLLLFASAVSRTYKSRVVIEGDLVTVRKSALGIPLTWRIPFSQVESVRVRHEIVEGLEGKKRDWDIEFDRKGQPPVRVGASFRERSEADRVAKEMLRLTRRSSSEARV